VEAGYLAPMHVGTGPRPARTPDVHSRQRCAVLVNPCPTWVGASLLRLASRALTSSTLSGQLEGFATPRSLQARGDLRGIHFQQARVLSFDLRSHAVAVHVFAGALRAVQVTRVLKTRSAGATGTAPVSITNFDAGCCVGHERSSRTCSLSDVGPTDCQAARLRRRLCAGRRE
jgi:hypothetical protein